MLEAIRRRHPAFRLAAAALVALAFVLASLSPASAGSPHRLAGPITDDVSALGGSTSGVQASLDDLQRATGAQLWVWYTDTLGGRAPGDFATATAQASDLGTTDLLLVIALNDRTYGYWKGDNVKVSDAELEQVLSQEMEPALQSTDYAGAITATAGGLQAAMAPGAARHPGRAGRHADPGPHGGARREFDRKRFDRHPVDRAARGGPARRRWLAHPSRRGARARGCAGAGDYRRQPAGSECRSRRDAAKAARRAGQPHPGRDG